MAVDKQIVKFLRQHHVLTLATSDADGLPYCANCFYVYDAERNRLIFASDRETHHGREMAERSEVACSVVLETRIVGRVRGTQICGKAERGDEDDKRRYIARFPYATLMPLTIWAIEPNFIKHTDNTLAFGHKLIWTKESE